MVTNESSHLAYALKYFYSKRVFLRIPLKRLPLASNKVKI